MKFEVGQAVQLLNTEYKPVCHAVVLHYDAETGKYEVEYYYNDPKKAEYLHVPPERLMQLRGD